MNKKIRLAFVGAGFVAQQTHLPCFSTNPNFQITHIADPCVDLRERIAQKYNIPYQVNSHLELISNKDIDAFIVTLPRKLTFYVVRDLINANKWVFTEKPLTLNSKDGYELLELIKNRKVSVKTGYMKQHDAGTELFRQLLLQIPKQDILSIKGYCHMGDSYAKPFGDIKGKSFVEIPYNEQAFPAWLPKENYWAFEQFINVFSHLTHLLELLLEEKIVFKDSLTNKNGEGLILCSISNIPICLDFIRGNQNQWNEGIFITTANKNLSIKYPPAFLRNVPSKICVKQGESTKESTEILPEWSWSFMNQTYGFYEFITNSSNNYKEVNLAIQQVEFAEEVFRSILNI